MSKYKAWINAFRFRTLPLSLSSILMGSFLALLTENFSIKIAILSITTTIFLQVLSNLANDYGDAAKGTDNNERIGPERAIQSGIISQKEMKTGIVICSFLALISGLALIYFGLKDIPFIYVLGFFILGISAIVAAIKYTVGKNPYGYAGLGDVFVFLFFGIVGVIGTFFLHTHSVQHIAILLLPASSIGLLSASVLNMNNMRDIENDRNSGKNTLVVKLGINKAKIYHSFLIIGGLLSFLLFLIFTGADLRFYLCFITLPIFLLNLKKVWTFKKNQELDPELKKLALSTFLITVVFGLCSII